MPKKEKHKKNLAMPLGPILGFFVGIISIYQGLDIIAGITLWITIWTATWWVFEAVPIPVASLVPISMLPLFGPKLKAGCAGIWAQTGSAFIGRVFIV